MGGTFNPIHIGHLIMAECAYEQYHLDKVLFMPCKNPPHKQSTTIISEEHRINMVKRAIQNNNNFELSLLEIERQGMTYTVDTISELVEKNPDIDYYFIIGADSLFSLDKWKSPEKLLLITKFIVASRYGMCDDELLERIKMLKTKYGGEFYITKIPTIDISSSQIRVDIGNSKSVRYQINDSVYDYILKNELYRVK